MSEPEEDEAVRRWRDWSPDSDSDESAEPQGLSPAENAGWSARLLAVAGAGVISGLAVLVIAAGWRQEGGGPGLGLRPRPAITGPVATVPGSPELDLLAGAGSSSSADRATITVMENGFPMDGRQLADGDLRTAWRVNGDATGQEIVITLADVRRIASVGLANGLSDGLEYERGRRVLAVRWTFDDGSSIVQRLRNNDPRPQVMDLPQERKSMKVTLTLEQVSQPGAVGGDFTAVSELRLAGY